MGKNLSRRELFGRSALLGLGAYGLWKWGIPEISGRIGDKPNIVLMSIDTMRRDYFTKEYLPKSFDWIGKNCLQFTNAHANSTWTLPSHVTMLTGLLPKEHKVEVMADRIPENVIMVQQELRRKGYKTVAFTGGGFVGSEHGFSKGFSEWYEQFNGDFDPFIEAKKYLNSLKGDKFEKPKFLFLHTYEIHDFKKGKDKKNILEWPKKYGQAVRRFDNKLMDLLNVILGSKLSNNLRIIITSDHGEGFGEKYPLYDHEYISVSHGKFPCPSQVKIPLVIYNSRDPTTGSLDKLVGLNDISSVVEFWGGVQTNVEDKKLFKEHEQILSMAIPFYTPREGRGIAVIGKKGKYLETYVETFGKYLSEDQNELPERVKERLRGLGYL